MPSIKSGHKDEKWTYSLISHFNIKVNACLTVHFYSLSHDFVAYFVYDLVFHGRFFSVCQLLVHW